VVLAWYVQGPNMEYAGAHMIGGGPRAGPRRRKAWIGGGEGGIDCVANFYFVENTDTRSPPARVVVSCPQQLYNANTLNAESESMHLGVVAWFVEHMSQVLLDEGDLLGELLHLRPVAPSLCHREPSARVGAGRGRRRTPATPPRRRHLWAATAQRMAGHMHGGGGGGGGGGPAIIAARRPVRGPARGVERVGDVGQLRGRASGERSVRY
jgi:hypothetical protein